MRKIALLFLVLSFAACGSDNGSGPAAAPNSPAGGEQPTSASSALVGEWLSGCAKFDRRWGKSAGELLRFMADGSTRTTTIHFATEDCRNPTVIVEWTGSYAIPEGTGSDSRPLDITYQKVEVGAYDSVGRRELNSERFCGFDDWEVDRLRDVTEKSGQHPCIGKTPWKALDVHAVEADSLKLWIGEPDGERVSTDTEPGMYSRRKPENGQ